MVAAALRAARAAVRHLRRAGRDLGQQSAHPDRRLAAAHQRRLLPDRAGHFARPRREERDPDRRVRRAQARGGPVGLRGGGRSGAPALPADPDDLSCVHPRRHAARVLERRRRRRAPFGGHRRDGRHARRDLPRHLLRADVLQADDRPPSHREALEPRDQGRGNACAQRHAHGGAASAPRAAPGSGMKRVFLLTLLAAAGCTMHSYEQPKLDLPEAWKQTAPRYAEDGRWWRIYADTDLEKTVDEALAANADLLIAVARVDETRALLGEANSFFWPRVDAQFAASRQQISTRTATSFPGIPREYSNHRAALAVSYELDLFGRLRSGAAAARAELEASEAARDAVRLALAAQVTKSYFSLRSLDEQVDLTRQTVQLGEEALELQKKRLKGGVISEFELRQLEAETAIVRAQLPPLEREREREEVALTLLLGRTPRQVFESRIAVKQSFGEEPGAPVVPSGLPSELLLRRPDLVEAERHLAAANARVGVARSEMFPTILLTGFLGSESQALSNLFAGGPAATWQLAAAITQPIFAGGRLAARTDAAQARERAALLQYEQAIRNAFGDVRTALIAQSRARESYDAESARAAALTESLRLARLRYQHGVASQLDVIDAERGLLAARIARIEALRAHRAAVADLFRALGG